LRLQYPLEFMDGRDVIAGIRDIPRIPCFPAYLQLLLIELHCARQVPLRFSLVCDISGHREDAEDALQDAFLKAFVHIKSFDNRSQFSTWLTRIAINSTLQVLRRKHSAAGRFRDLTVDSEGFDPATIPDRAPGPETKYAQRE
jgi:RNA polymerase sigma factor (sigma-70 family)